MSFLTALKEFFNPQPIPRREMCECTDYKERHENGGGKCLVCNPKRQSFPVCQRFKFMGYEVIGKPD